MNNASDRAYAETLLQNIARIEEAIEEVNEALLDCSQDILSYTEQLEYATDEQTIAYLYRNLALAQEEIVALTLELESHQQGLANDQHQLSQLMEVAAVG